MGTIVRAVLLAIAFVCAAAPAAAGSLGTPDIRSTFPCKATEHKFGQGKGTLLLCATKKAIYQIIVSPVDLTKISEEEIAAAMIEGCKKATGGGIRRDIKITANGMTGRDVLIDMPGGEYDEYIVRLRLFIYKNMSVTLSYIGPAGTENRADAARFFDSFSIKS